MAQARNAQTSSIAILATIVFWVAPFVGHLHSTLGLAERMRDRGHRVLFAGPEALSSAVADQGFPFVEVPFARPFPGGGGRRARKGRGSAGGWMARWRQLRRETRELAEVLRGAPAGAERIVAEWSPDLIVFDPFQLMYSIPFHRRVPVVALSTKPLLDHDPLVPPYTSGVVPRDGSRVTLWRVRLAWWASYARYALHQLQSLGGRLASGYSAYGLSQTMAVPVGFPLRQEWAMRSVPFDFRLRSTPEIVLWPVELELPRRKPLRASVHYAGPCLSIDRREPPLVLGEIGEDRFVLASFGTVEPRLNRDLPRFLKRLIEAFRDLDARLVISLGGSEIELEELTPSGVSSGGPSRRLPANVQVLRSMPQIAALRRANLFICHGGASSVKESLRLGVPLLIYPQRSDQPGNAARVVYHNLGLRGDVRRDDVAAIRAKVRTLLEDPGWRERAASMQKVFERYEMERPEVALLESFLAR